MNLKSTNKVETNRCELEIEIPKEQFQEALEKAYRKEAGRITVPGFRKGKAPKSFIEKCYGKEVFYEEAINIIYPVALDEAIKEASLDVIDDHIGLDIVNVGEDGLTFKATVTVKPDVTVGEYKGIEIEGENAEVTDEDVENELKSMQERNARLITVEDRAAQDGDIAVIDFEGFCDGKAFEGGKAEKYDLTLGQGSFIPGFEEQIVGHNAGDEFDINVTFPEDYQAAELAGKDTVFKIKLHEIKNKELPELDDEFAKDVSEFDTLEEYKQDLRNKLLEDAKKKAEINNENKIIAKVIDSVEGEIPEAMFKHKIAEIAREFEYHLHSQGLDTKTYLQYTGMDEEAFNNTFRPQAERQVKLRLALEKIAKLENLVALEEDIKNEYSKISDQYKMEVEKIKSLIPEAELAKDILVEKAIDLVKKSAVIK